MNKTFALVQSHFSFTFYVSHAKFVRTIWSSFRRKEIQSLQICQVRSAQICLRSLRKSVTTYETNAQGQYLSD